MGCLHQVDKTTALLHDIQRILLPPFREGWAVLIEAFINQNFIQDRSYIGTK